MDLVSYNSGVIILVMPKLLARLHPKLDSVRVMPVMRGGKGGPSHVSRVLKMMNNKSR